MDAGSYLVRALIDQNANRVLDRNEKWDTTTVTVADARPMIELDVIERDSSAAAFQNIVVDDSVTIHVSFDKPLDPAIPLQPALVRLQRADSSQLVVTNNSLVPTGAVVVSTTTTEGGGLTGPGAPTHRRRGRLCRPAPRAVPAPRWGARRRRRQAQVPARSASRHARPRIP